MAFLMPIAHAGHWLWVLYLPPVLIVIGSLLATKRKERKLGKGDPSVSDDNRSGR